MEVAPWDPQASQVSQTSAGCSRNASARRRYGSFPTHGDPPYPLLNIAILALGTPNKVFLILDNPHMRWKEQVSGCGV